MTRKTMKGWAIFPAQFARSELPFDTLDGLAGWTADLSYNGIQVPTGDPKLFDLELRIAGLL
jgi:hypothetical protein